MIVRVAVALAGVIALAACGAGSSPEARRASAGGVVEIPEITAEQAAKAEKEEVLPRADRREAPAPAETASGEAAVEDSDPMWGPALGHQGTGGPDCDRAADCCLKFVQRNGPDPSLLSMCDGIRRAPSTSCVHLLTSFRSLAPQIGVQCN